jgi:hypothetical protein
VTEQEQPPPTVGSLRVLLWSIGTLDDALSRGAEAANEAHLSATDGLARVMPALCAACGRRLRAEHRCDHRCDQPTPREATTRGAEGYA